MPITYRKQLPFSARNRRRAGQHQLGVETLESRHLLTVVFTDSFESGANSNDWVGAWAEDAQNDWFRSTQRATDGVRSAEVDGWASDATLSLANTIDLTTYSSAELTFDWLIESRFDSGEYLALDVSADGGATWQNNIRRLNGNVDAENSWHSETVDLTPYASSDVSVRFRAKASRGNEDANVDNVVITGTPIVVTEPTAEFIPLGFLPGQSESGARTVTADGRFVIGNSGSEAFRWSRETGMINLGAFTARDVSADGSVVVGGVLDVGALRWENGTLTPIGDLTSIDRTDDDPGGTIMDDANGISADGSIVVGNTGFDFKGEADSFRIVDSAIQPIGDLPGGAHASGVNAVSADGSIVAGQGDSGMGGTEAFLWEGGTFTPLGDLPGGGFESRAWTMSKDGQFVVGQSQSAAGLEAYLWSAETGMIGLGHLPGETTDSRARGVNGTGTIVVGTANHGQSKELRDAFIWDEANGMRKLQSVLATEYGLGDALAGWTLTGVTMSDDGLTYVGSGFNPNGLQEAFVVILDDESTPPNEAPVANAGGPYTTNEGQSISLDGSSSSDADGSIVSFEWDLNNDGQFDDATGVSTTFNSTDDGIYTVGLRVTDDTGAVSTDTALVTVNNVAPTANAGGPYTTEQSVGVTVSAAASSDPGNDIVEYEWDLDDDGQYDDATGVTTSFSSATAGDFTINVRVTDDDGHFSTDSASITVGEAGPTPLDDTELVAHWTLDNTTADSAPFGSIADNGTLTGNASFATDGTRGQVIELDGSGDRLDVADSSDLNKTVVTQRTISLWFNADDVSSRQVLFEAGGGTRGLSIYIDAGQLYVGGWNKPNGESGWGGTFLSTTLSAGTWHNVVLTLDGSTSVQENALKGYLDGALFGSGNGSQLWNHSGDVGIGMMDDATVFHDGNAGGDGYGLAGRMDDIRIYDRVFASDEVENLWLNY